MNPEECIVAEGSSLERLKCFDILLECTVHSLSSGQTEAVYVILRWYTIVYQCLYSHHTTMIHVSVDDDSGCGRVGLMASQLDGRRDNCIIQLSEYESISICTSAGQGE